MCALDYAQIAHLYDAYVKTKFDVPFFLQETARCTHVLELMCGTGRVPIPLLKAGVKRVICASSLMANWGYQLDEPYKAIRECRFEELRFDIFFGVSDNGYRWVDLEHPRQVLGYVPLDRAERFL
jgi:hypothetical protein